MMNCVLKMMILQFLAVALSAIGLGIVPLVNTVPHESPVPEKTTAKSVRCRLLMAYGIVCLLAVVLGLIAVAAAGLLPGGVDLLPEDPPARYRYLTAIVGGLLALFCFLPCGTVPILYRRPKEPGNSGLCGCCGCCCACCGKDNNPATTRKASVQR